MHYSLSRMISACALSLVTGILVVGLITGKTATAQAQMAPTQQVELTPQLIEGVLATFPAIRDKAETLQSNGSLPEGEADNPVEAMAAYMQYQGAMSEFDGIVRAEGFEGFAHWLSVVTSTAQAIVFSEQGGAVDSQMAEAIRQIENNPQFSEAQKKMMLDQMKAAMGSVSAMRPSDASLAAVEPYVEQLKAMFDMD